MENDLLGTNKKTQEKGLKEEPVGEEAWKRIIAKCFFHQLGMLGRDWTFIVPLDALIKTGNVVETN